MEEDAEDKSADLAVVEIRYGQSGCLVLEEAALIWLCNLMTPY